jgi:hypothetical protein
MCYALSPNNRKHFLQTAEWIGAAKAVGFPLTISATYKQLIERFYVELSERKNNAGVKRTWPVAADYLKHELIFAPRVCAYFASGIMGTSVWRLHHPSLARTLCVKYSF